MLRGVLLALILTSLSAPGFAAEAQQLGFGGDLFAAGETVGVATPVDHDAFAAGRDVSLDAAVGGNAHLFGLNVTTGAGVSGDLYAAAFAVNVDAPVAGSLSAAGNSVSVKSGATIGGNARLAGSTVTLAAPVVGSALVTAQTARLEGTVGGDFSFYGETLTFGPGATVAGMLSIRAPKPVDVPASVAPPERVNYQVLQNPDYASQAGTAASGVVNSVWPTVWAGVAWWLLLFLVGAAFILWAPGLTASLQAAAARRPWRNLGLGVLGFASSLGLLPVAAMSVVGLVLVPFLLLFIAVLCGLGYLAGAYFLGLRLIHRLLPVESNGRRVAVLAGTLVAAGILGAIPFLGWLVSLTLTVFGIGLIVVLVMDRWTARDAARSAPLAAAPSV